MRWGFFLLLLAGYAWASSPTVWKTKFESAKIKQLPKEWEFGATKPEGEMAKWQVQFDLVLKSQVFGISSLGKVVKGRFNLAWLPKKKAKDVSVSVMFRSVSGEIDQGGGVLWRFQNPNNYYIARFNPLEDNFRIYYVKDGDRETLGSADRELKASEWHQLKIVHKGNHIQGFLDGQKLLDVKDEVFQSSGNVGLWTKADAITYFDNFEFRSISYLSE